MIESEIRLLKSLFTFCFEHKAGLRCVFHFTFKTQCHVIKYRLKT